MQVSGKMLLNSAEGILRERSRNGGQAQAGISAGEEVKKSGAENVSQDGLQARLLKLQAELGRVQKEYSREQARQAYLQGDAGGIKKDLYFEDAPLFPEVGRNFDPAQLREKVEERMQSLSRNLKGIQVEMENLYALNYSSYRPNQIPDADSIGASSMKALDPDRVARLTR